MKSVGHNKSIDGGWAWVVLTSGVFSLFINGFVAYSTGILNVALIETYSGDLSFTSTIVAMVSGVMGTSGPLAGVIINRLGCRACSMIGGFLASIGMVGASLARNLTTVFWTFGVATGLGFGLCYTSTVVIVGFYFNRLRPLATGLTLAGGALGMFAGPPLVQLLINHYGLSGAFLILAGISSHCCLFGSLLRPVTIPKRKDESVIGTDAFKRSSDKSKYLNHYWQNFKRSFHLFKNFGFLLYLSSTFCWSTAETACFTHLPAYCIKKGSSKQQASFVMSVMGIANLSTRIITGFAANDVRISKVMLLFGQMFLAGVFTGLFPLIVTSYEGQMAYSVLLGLYSCGANTLMSLMAVELVGIKDLPSAFGFIAFLSGLGCLTGPSIAGAIVDRGATYRESFIFASCVYFLSGLSALLIPLVHKRVDDNSYCMQDRGQSIELTVVNNPVSEFDDQAYCRGRDESDNRTSLLDEVNPC